MTDQTLAEGDCYLSTAKAAKLIGVSAATLTSWRSRRADGPPAYPISNRRLCVYKRSELIAWVEQFRRETGVKIVPLKPGQPPRPWER